MIATRLQPGVQQKIRGAAIVLSRVDRSAAVNLLAAGRRFQLEFRLSYQILV